MPKVQELNGLLAVPTAGGRGGFSFSAPAIDTSVGTAALKVSKQATKYLRSAYEDLKEARVSDFRNKYRIVANEKLYGKNGAMLLKGEEVAKGVEGESFTAHYTSVLDSERDKLADELGLTEIERDEAFALVDNDRTGFVTTLQSHEGLENVAYIKNTNEATISAAKLDIMHGGDVSRAMQDIRRAKLSDARLDGAALGLKDTIDVIDHNIKTEVSGALVGRLDILLTNNQLDLAQATMVDAIKKDYLTPTDMVTARQTIDKAIFDRDAKAGGEVVGRRIVMQSTPEQIILNAAGKSGNVKDLATLAGLDPAVFDSVPDGDANAIIVGGVLRNTGGDVQQALGVMLLGQSTVKNAVARATEYNEKTGANKAWLEFISEGDKKAIGDAYTKYLTDSRTMAKPTVEDVNRTVRAMYPTASPELRSAIAVNAAENMANIEAEKQARRADAMMYAIQNGQVTGVFQTRPQDALLLSPDQAAALRTMETRQAKGEDYSVYEVQYRLQSDPNKLKNMPEADWYAQKAYLSDRAWKDLDMLRRSLLGAKDVNLDISYGEVNNAVDYAIRNIGASLPSDKDERDAWTAMYRDVVAAEVRRVQAQKGATLSQTEYQDTAIAVLKARVETAPGIFTDAKSAMFADFRAGDLTSDAKKVAKLLTESEDPSDPLLVQTVRQYMYGLTTYVPKAVTDNTVFREFKSQYERVNKVTLDDTTAVRLFFLAQHGGKYRMEAVGVQSGLMPDAQSASQYRNMYTTLGND